ncbi:MAG: hypothetical protein LBL75_01820 [Rickettsiales bacterium]|jgi:phosphoribosylglycinamide formyltransferase-1|nr:hypothetical protein [Rickettsiales bacterium]
MADRKKVLIMASGSGSNAEALVRSIRLDNLPVDFYCASDKSGDKAGVYARMKQKLSIETQYIPSPLIKTDGAGVFPKPRDWSNLIKFLEKHNFDLIVLAGYMLILPPQIASQYKIINIHPAITPFAHVGATDAYADALRDGDTATGCTVHHVIPQVDAGERIAQIGFMIPENINLDTLKQIGLTFEHQLYPAVVKQELFYSKLDLMVIAGNASRELARHRLPWSEILIPENRKVFDTWEYTGRGGR